MRKLYFHFFCVFLLFSGIVKAQMPTSFSPRGIGGGGALFSPSINPANPSEIYIACDMSQMFHSTNKGSSWDMLDFRTLQAGHDAEVQFTNNTSTMYCLNYRPAKDGSDMTIPVKSTDAGKTWKKLPGNPDSTAGTYKIAVNYNNPNQVLIGYYGQLYFSNDGGSTFKNIHNAVNNGSGVLVGGVLFSGSSIFIGTNDGVLASTDGGSNFSMASLTGIPSGQQIFSFAAARSGNSTRLFCLTANTSDIYVGVLAFSYNNLVKGVYSVTLSGSSTSGTWQSVGSGINLSSSYPVYIRMAATDTSTAWIAGGSATSAPIVLKYTGATKKWTNTFLTTSNQNITTGWSGSGGDKAWSFPEVSLGFTVDMNDASKLIFTDYSFASLSTDGGSTWNQVYVNPNQQNAAGSNTTKGKSYSSIGLENTTCWQVYWADKANMFSCFSDISGVRSVDSGYSWSFNYTGHSDNSMYRIVKNISSNTMYGATSTVHDMYQSTRLQDASLDAGKGKVLQSTDKGATWTLLHDFAHPVIWLATNPKAPNQLYASVINSSNGGIFVSYDVQNGATSTWKQLPNPTRTEGHPFNVYVLNDGKVLCTYSGRRNSSGAFTKSSGVFLYDSATNSWADVSDPGMMYWTKDITIDPGDASQNTWYVGVFSGWGGAPNGLGALYKTTDRGKNWKKVFTQAQRVTGCTINPNNHSEMYLTTETDGLWYCANATASAPTFTQVSSYPFRQPERVFFNPYDKNQIWVSSFGNGMRMGYINKIPVSINNTQQQYLPLDIYPNPAANEVTIQYPEQIKGDVCISLYDLNGRCLKTIKAQANQAGTLKVALNDFKSGTYIIGMGSATGVATSRLIIIK